MVDSPDDSTIARAGRVRRAFLLGAVVLFGDQLTKAVADSLMNGTGVRPVMNPDFFLGLVGASRLVTVVVAMTAIIAFGTLVTCQARTGTLPMWVPGLLVGGAVSNVADRLLFGAVRDFLATPLAVWNFADLAILVGLAGYAWAHLGHRKLADGSTRGGE